MKFSVYLVLSKISTETKSASACMESLPPFFDSFYSNPETRVAKLSIATGVGGWVWEGRGLGQTPAPAAVSWYLESAKS